MRSVLCVLLLLGACAGGSLDVATQEPPTLAPMLEKVLPGVVTIDIEGKRSEQEMALLSDPELRRLFGLPKRLQPEERMFQGIGSGIVIDAAKGYIVTTNHLIEGADRITVSLGEKREGRAHLIGGDPATDVALIQVTLDGLVAVPLGNSDRVRVGDYVVAIGNPFGLGQTATLGIVGALGAKDPETGREAFIQTDASINPGNSGGGLFNLKGELVGINNSLVGTLVSNSGIAFAIPITPAKAAVDRLIRQGGAGSAD